MEAISYYCLFVWVLCGLVIAIDKDMRVVYFEMPFHVTIVTFISLPITFPIFFVAGLFK